jgi:hypothetical protein
MRLFLIRANQEQILCQKIYETQKSQHNLELNTTIIYEAKNNTIIYEANQEQTLWKKQKSQKPHYDLYFTI